MKRIILGFIFSALVSQSVAAQTILTDTQKSDLAKLESCQVIPRGFHSGQSQLSKDAWDKLKELQVAQISSSLCSDVQVQALLNRLVSELQSEAPQKGVRVNWIESAEAKANYLSGGDSSYPANQRGTLNAIANPFRENQNGEMIGEGGLFRVTTEHSLAFDQQLLYVAPSAALNVSSGFDRFDQAQLTVNQAFADFRFWGLQTTVGRAPITWGQGRHGGLLFGNNSRALDHLHVTHQKAFRLPWVFSYLGEWKLDYILGNFGPDEQTFPWSYFTGLQVGLKPHDRIELNLSHAMEFGGENSPSLPASMGAREFFGFIPYVSQTGRGGSNKLTALNFRVHWDELMGAQIYGAYMMDDANLSSGGLGKHFRHNSTYFVGWVWTRFFNDLNQNFRLEYTKTAPIAYRHYEFLQGWTSNQMILGDSLGPDGHEVDVTWDINMQDDWFLQVNAIWQARESNVYSLSADGLSVGYITDGTQENRYASLFKLMHRFDRIDLSGQFGVMYTQNQNYNPSHDAFDVFAGVNLKYRFKSHE